MKYEWWQRGVIYQVYPRSFADANGDGIGDLPGILSRMDYLQWLGVDAVWISPIYPSPMADFGYDISDYCAIHPLFGAMADFDRLLAEVHRRGMKLLLDFVPNHTSDLHPWFRESRSSRDNPKRDWYLWHDADAHGGPPTNWLSVFGGSAWEWDAQTGQYYYHAFLKEQPDLNWRNPAVVEAMLNVMRFWLDKGVDGFRVDVMWHMIKDQHFRDNPINPHYNPGDMPYFKFVELYNTDQPEVHQIVQQMRQLLDGYGERLLIGEIYLPLDKLMSYYGQDGSGAHLPFNFQLINLPWNAREIDLAISAYEASLPEGGWPNWVLGNHDKPRIASRVGAAQARVAAMLLLTLRGTPTIYYGDEICMHDVPIPFEQQRDPQGLRQGLPEYSRDPQRTPMQWSGDPAAGFTTGQSWLPIAHDAAYRNVEAQRADRRSMLTLYRKLIDLRRSEPALCIGDYRPVPAAGELLAFIREDGKNASFLVALNLGHAPGILQSEHFTIQGQVVVATTIEREGELIDGLVELDGDDGLVIRLNG